MEQVLAILLVVVGLFFVIVGIEWIVGVSDTARSRRNDKRLRKERRKEQ